MCVHSRAFSSPDNLIDAVLWSTMPNRQLTPTERRELFEPLIQVVRAELQNHAKRDRSLLWALRRKLAKELTYDERGTPMERRALKARKRRDQDGRCPGCQAILPARGADLHRLEAMEGYTDANTQLLCRDCHGITQSERGYA